jgi:hypothetical protein
MRLPQAVIVYGLIVVALGFRLVPGAEADSTSFHAATKPGSDTTRQNSIAGSDDAAATPSAARPVMPQRAIVVSNGMARIMVVSFPAAAKVLIDDSLVGVTPFQTDSLPAGTHALILKAEGFNDFEKVDRFIPLSRRKIIVHLTSRHASLSVRSTPPGASVSLNGAVVGVTPFDTATLTPGTYSLALDMARYLTYRSSFVARENGHDTVAQVLVSQAYHDSLLTAAKKKRQIARRVAFGVVGSGFALAGILVNQRAQEYLNSESAALNTYNQPNQLATEYNTSWSDYQTNQRAANRAMTTRNVLYAISAVFIAGFGISIPF